MKLQLLVATYTPEKNAALREIRYKGTTIRQGMGLNLFKIFTLLASSKLLIIFKWQPVTKIIAFYFNHELDFFRKTGLF